jgi:predicted MFS family arabinose efflux permease
VTLGAGLAPSFGVLLVMRALAGIFGGFGPAVVIAAAGDLFPPSRRGMAMGWANLGFSMAAIVGVPSIGAIGGTIGWRWAFAATGLLVISLGVLIQRTFPKLRVVRAESDDATSYLAALRVPGLWSILAANVFERALFTQVPGLAISVAGGTIFTLVNASSRPALLALSAELSTRYRGAIMGVFSVTNQAGVVLGASVGGLAIGVGGYSALALTMAVDAALASSLALPLLRRRPAG